jgi:hypothetical protein
MMNRELATPDEVAKAIKVGMKTGEVAFSIDPRFGGKACYLIYCKSEPSFEPTTTFIPTREETVFPIWFFMPQSDKTQPTAVFFRKVMLKSLQYDTTMIVIGVNRFDYDTTKTLIKNYGTRVKSWAD